MGQFWDLKQSFYSESINEDSSYDTYEKFVSGIRNDATIDDFAYTNPFSFIPSYGSTVSFDFSNNYAEFGDGYVIPSATLLNNTSISMELKFDDRSDKEAMEIINYIKNTGTYSDFPYQTFPRDTLSDSDSYKSIYSLPPYFIQEFKCDSINHELKYNDQI